MSVFLGLLHIVKEIRAYYIHLTNKKRGIEKHLSVLRVIR